MAKELCYFACWGVALAIGVIFGVIVANAVELGFFVGLIAGLIATLGIGWLLPSIVCPSARADAFAPPAPTVPRTPDKSRPEATPAASAPAPASMAPAPANPVAPEESAPAGSSDGGHWTDGVAADSGKAGEGRGATDLKPSAPLAEEATVRDGVGSWRYESDAKPYRAEAASADGEDFDGDGVVEGKGEGVRPAALDGPRGGVADDLKKIKGVGPKMEKLLNSLGFYHFDQVAGWSADEVAWVDANLEGFKGRVSRDEWVAQAKLLASGGETAFSKKVDDGDVY